MEITVEIPGVKLGVLEAEEVRVELVVPKLARELEEVCERMRRGLTLEQVEGRAGHAIPQIVELIKGSFK